VAVWDELSVASCVGEVDAEFVVDEVKEVEGEEVSECRERDCVGSEVPEFDCDRDGAVVADSDGEAADGVAERVEERVAERERELSSVEVAERERDGVSVSVMQSEMLVDPVDPVRNSFGQRWQVEEFVACVALE
jgi:hypothetical protein